LKAEAIRIHKLDYLIQTNSTHLTMRPVDFDQIDTDVRNTLKYVRGAKYALRPPSLREEVGVYASDGVVPDLLHQEVGVCTFLMRDLLFICT
jgi:hypothetical protein